MKNNIKNNSNILNIMFTVYYNLLIEMFEFIFGFYDVIKDKIVLLMLNENIQDYLNNFLYQPYNIIYLGLCLIYFFGLLFYNYEHYFIISVINSFILFFSLTTNFCIYMISNYYNSELKWIAYVLILPFIMALVNNINLLFNQNKLDGTLHSNIINTYNDLKSIDLTDELFQEYNKEYDKDYERITDIDINNLYISKEFLDKHLVPIELDNYVKNNIEIYKKYLVHNLRFTIHDINDIKGIFNNKITEDELKKLIQIINKIIERKIK